MCVGRGVLFTGWDKVNCLKNKYIYKNYTQISLRSNECERTKRCSWYQYFQHSVNETLIECIPSSMNSALELSITSRTIRNMLKNTEC